MNKKIKNKGFTLLELIAVIAILAIMYTIIFQIFTSQMKIYNNEIVKNDVQNSGRLCLNYISGSIRGASHIDTTIVYESLNGLSGQSKRIMLVNNNEYKYIINDKKLYKYVNATNFSMIASNVDDIVVTINNADNSGINSIYKINVNIDGKYFMSEMSLRNLEV